MVNSQMVKEISEAFKIDERIEKIPNAIPVCEANPKIIKNGFTKYNVLNAATSAVIYTTPADQDFYLTSAAIAFIKDSSSTSTLFQINYTEANASTSIPLLYYPSITLTAQSGSNNIVLPHPVKIKRNTQITISTDQATAVVRAAGTISGFIDEVN